MTAQPDIAADGSAAEQNAAIVVRFFTEVLATGAAGRAADFWLMTSSTTIRRRMRRPAAPA